MAQTVLAQTSRWGCDVKGFTNAAERMDARERPVLGELERDLKIYTKKIYTTPPPRHCEARSAAAFPLSLAPRSGQSTDAYGDFHGRERRGLAMPQIDVLTFRHSAATLTRILVIHNGAQDEDPVPVGSQDQAQRFGG
jgi:hypothetical protein